MAQQFTGYQMMLVILLFLFGACITQSMSDEQDDENRKDPWEGYQLPPQPWKGYDVYLRSCVRVLTKKCGLEMYDFIFRRRRGMSMSCCLKLVKIGEMCSTQLSYTLSHIKAFARNRGNIYLRSEHAYRKCAKRVMEGVPKSSPML